MNDAGPVRIASPSEIVVQVNTNGSVRRIDHRDVMVNAYLGSEIEGGPANLFLRILGDPIRWTPLIGPRSPGTVRVGEDGLVIEGEWQGLRVCVSLVLAASAPAWFWHVALENAGDDAKTVDLVHAQDLALSDYGGVRLNEYYVSQYVDHAPLAHPERGVVLAARQNLSIGGRHPWLAIGSLGRATSFCTDAMQLQGLVARAGGAPPALQTRRLPGVRLQHEHAMAVLQEEPVRLSPGARATRGFFAWLEPDHPAASSEADLAVVARALALPEASPPAPRPRARGAAPGSTLFSDAPLLVATDLGASEIGACFGELRRAEERDGERLLSFFTQSDAHVVLAAKERASLRPHGQILRTGDRLAPDEASLTTTVWMDGVFHSMVTQGHVSIGRLLSTTHAYLGLFRSHGQRIFVELDGAWRQLGVPSAFEMTLDGARWIYVHAGGRIEVRSRAPLDRHELWLEVRVLEGPACRFLLSHHVAVNGDDGADSVPVRWRRDAQGIAIDLLPDTDLGRRFPGGGFRIDPTPQAPIERAGGDELLFLDGRSRRQPFVVLVTSATVSVGLRITGQLTAPPPNAGPDPAETGLPGAASESAWTVAPASQRFWKAMTGALALHAPACADAERLETVLPWLAHDAWIHHLAPRGLEQYSGGGWGTRDVCQGPVELLLSVGRAEPIRELLRCVFCNQNEDGDWPQWFMFFDRERNIRPGDSHGDIVFWPLLALAQYLLASDDAALLDEELPFFHPEGEARAERATLIGHVERALALIERRVIPGTRLAVYGNGDWNDALQLVDRPLAERVSSAWTVTLQHQTLATLAAALRSAGRSALATRLDVALAEIARDFERLLVVDGIVAGLTVFREDGSAEHWLHPSDATTGIHYSLLPMVHAILANLFTAEQAAAHRDLIRRHLLAADGARLFDRPIAYRGGVQTRFQRAETSSFFGREIGLLYTHAHLRYAEAMAHLGEADAFFLALRQANPVGLREAVPSARLRQANCYTSSSDAVFADRFEASARYDAVRTGAVAVEGGWRVYSSGAGIFVRLVRERLLGLRLRRASLGVDPVLPRALDGLRAVTDLEGHRVAVHYRAGTRGFGPRSIVLNGVPLPFAREPNPYREGGGVVAMDEVRTRLREGANELRIEVG